ncbi:MAG TPA: hypothetical protein VF756_09345 [Thermoanaerobaculia bacterium]
MDDLIDGLWEVERKGQQLLASLQQDDKRWVEPLICALETMRDCRWDLMILRSEMERGEDGPEFTTGEELRQFMKSKGLLTAV